MPARGVIAGATLVAALVLGAAAGPAQSAARPALRLVDTAPLTFKGAGFRSLERVSVQVRTAGSALSTARVRADRLGGFTVKLPRVALERCGAAYAIATGVAGSRAVAKIVYQLCPPPLRSPRD